MSYSFEWDPVKAVENLRKHGVSFEEAESIFDDPLLVTYPDLDHSDYEDRYINIGISSEGRILMLSIQNVGTTFVSSVVVKQHEPKGESIRSRLKLVSDLYHLRE